MLKVRRLKSRQAMDALSIPGPTDVSEVAEHSGNTLNVYGNVFSVAGNYNSNVQIGVGSVQGLLDEILAMLKEYVDARTWDIHKDVSEKRTPGTGSTFRSREDVETWVKTLRSVFWATGGPGAGKTCLASFMFDELSKLALGAEDSAVAITYLQFNDNMSAWDIVMVLIIHLVECNPLPTVLEHLRQAFAEYKKRNSRPTFDQLSQIFQSTVKKYQRCWIFFDGLDEKTPEIQALLIKVISNLEANVFLTSRNLELVQKKLEELRDDGRLVFITFAAQDEDLQLYIDQVIHDSPRLSHMLDTPSLRKKLSKKVKQKAEGMFLHVTLQMEAVKDCLDIEELFDVVDQFPLGMDALYTETMKRIERQPGTQPIRAKHGLSLILCAAHLLSLEEFQHAVAAFPPDYQINPARIPSKEDLVTICCGLLSIDSKSQLVRFVHLTAKEALRSLLSPTFPAPNAVMAQTCLSCLVTAGLQDFSPATLQDLLSVLSSTKTPFLKYAYRAIASHCRLGVEEQPNFLHRLVKFVEDCHSFPYHDPSFTDPSSTFHEIQLLRPIHVASALGIPTIVDRVLKAGGNGVNLRAGCSAGLGWTSLMVAAGQGHTGVVKYLMDIAETQVEAVDGHGVNALMIAAARGHYAIAEMFLERRDARAGWGNLKQIWLKLLGRASPVEFFDLDQQDDRGWTALEYARYRDHNQVASLLETTSLSRTQRRRAEDGRKTEGLCQNRILLVATFELVLGFIFALVYGITPFTMTPAAPETTSILDQTSLDSILLSRPTSSNLQPSDSAPDVSAPSTRILTAANPQDGGRHSYQNATAREASRRLLKVAEAGYTDVVQSILAIPDVDVNVKNKNGSTPLMLSSSEGHEGVVQLLLAVPAVDLNHRNRFGLSAFALTAAQGYPGTLKQLIDAPGIDMESENFIGRTGFLYACYHGRTKVVELLLSTPGVDIHKKDDNGDSGLMLAALNGHEEVVKLLLAVPELDVNALNEEQESALFIACRRGHEGVVKLLLDDRRIQRVMSGEMRQAAVEIAREWDQQGIVGLLEGLPDS